ncbi:MAG: TolC family protein [Candidatus Latescibacterota bacterium]|nr:MAG: TolC family protein [Candidatus Latescibacterota bacterium]
MKRQDVRWLFPLFILISLGSATRTPAQESESRAATSTLRSMTLTSCIQFAIQNSRDLVGSRLGLEVANKQVREAWGEVLPQVDANFNYIRNLTDQSAFLPAIILDPNADPNAVIPVQFAGDNIWASVVTFEQPLFQAEAFIGVGAAGRFRSLQTERVRGTAHATVMNVRIFYYETLLARDEIRLLQESIERVETTLAGARGLQAAGLGSSYDVLRLEVELAKLVPNRQRAQNRLLEAKRNLKVLMGMDVGQAIAVSGSLLTIDLEDLDANAAAERELIDVVGVRVGDGSGLEEILELARQNRSELLQARLDTQLADTQLKAERATVYPRLMAFAAYRIDAQENDSPDFFGDSRQRVTNWQAGLRLEVPIFSGGSRWARISQRKYQLDQVRTREALTEQEVENQVRSLVARILEAYQRARAQRRAVAQAQRGFEIASAEFTNGLGTQINATDAEVALREAEFDYAESVFDLLVARAQLDTAAGIVPFVDPIEEGS